MNNFFNSIGETIRAKKTLFVLLILLSVVVAVIAVVSAINLNGSIVPIDLSNITFIKFLRGDCGFLFFIVGTLLNLLLFYLAIIFCCCKKFLLPLTIMFYLYFVYSQVLIFTSVLLIYGMLNTFILLLLLLVFLLMLFFVFMLMILCLTCISGQNYFSCCFKPSSSPLLFLSILIVALTILFCITISILKSFVILLVF